MLVAYLNRIAAAIVIALLSRILDFFGIGYTPDDMSKIAVEVVHFMVEWVIPLLMTFATVIKVSLDKRFNKGNASAAPLVKEHNAVADAIGTLELEKKKRRRQVNRQ